MDTLERLKGHSFTPRDILYVFYTLYGFFWIYLMTVPPFPYKLLIPIIYITALAIPLTSQFFFPASPIFAYLLTFYASRFIPEHLRPPISVSTLPTLESTLYGANISDLLTRFTHPVLDIIAWVPYGVGHYILPFVVAAVVWLFAPKPALQTWARIFGYTNLIGVLCQTVFPCAAPCASSFLFPVKSCSNVVAVGYELIHGLTPANYSMKGSPGGLARIDALFHSSTYTVGFSHSPLVFGAFPSLHAACATLEALFISHFFPQLKVACWTYAGVLYWATMYLTHHYLIDVVAGGCLAVAAFYFFMPEEFKDLNNNPRRSRSKYESYDLEEPVRRASSPGGDSELASEDEGEQDITYRAPKSPVGGDAAPLTKSAAQAVRDQGHRHTASIASLIRGEDRSDEGWGGLGGRGLPVNGERSPSRA